MAIDRTAPAAAARRIIGKFGGPANLTRVLSMSNPRDDGKPLRVTTVQAWLSAGIPVQWHHPILDAAKRAAVGIAIEDFFEVKHDGASADRLSPAGDSHAAGTD